MFAELDAPALMAAAGAALRARPLQDREGPHRLPRRDRRPPLQRAPRAGRPDAGGTAHDARRGAAAARPAGCRPCPQLDRRGGFTTVDAHMPAAHRPTRMDAPAADPVGPAHRHGHRRSSSPRAADLQAPRARLPRLPGAAEPGEALRHARLEAACERALALGAVQYRHVRDMLVNNRDLLDQAGAAPLDQPGTPTCAARLLPVTHCLTHALQELHMLDNTTIAHLRALKLPASPGLQEQHEQPEPGADLRGAPGSAGRPGGLRRGDKRPPAAAEGPPEVPAGQLEDATPSASAASTARR